VPHAEGGDSIPRRSESGLPQSKKEVGLCIGDVRLGKVKRFLAWDGESPVRPSIRLGPDAASVRRAHRSGRRA